MERDVKIMAGGVSHLTDARYFAARQIDWIGFNFDPLSGKKVSVDSYLEMMKWIEGPIPVAELGNMSNIDIEKILKETKIDHLQFSHQKSEDLCLFDTKTTFLHLPATVIDMAFLTKVINNTRDQTSYYIIETHRSSALCDVDMKKIETICSMAGEAKILIDVPYGKNNILQVLDMGIIGVHLSGKEEGTGIRNYDDDDELIDAVRGW